MSENQSRKPLIWETACSWLLSAIRKNAAVITASMISGFLAYMFLFTNKLINHDEASGLFSKGWTVIIGRWGLGGLDTIFPNYSMPWIYGVMAICFVTAAICLMVHIFSIRSKLLQVLLAGCVMVCPALIGTMSYTFTVAPYMLSFFLSVLSVFLVKQEKRLPFLGAFVCCVFSLSIYQSYIAVTASLLVLILIQQLLQGDSAAAVIRRGFLFLGFLVISLGAYYAATLVINYIKDIEFHAYASSNMHFSIWNLPQSVCRAYAAFLRCFTTGEYGVVPTAFSRVVHGFYLIALGVLFLFWGLSQKKVQWGRIALLAALVGILPLAINCMHLFMEENSIHSLVMYSFVAVYVLGAILAEECLPILARSKAAALSSKAALHVLTLAMALAVVINIYIANESYLHLYLGYENTYSFYTSLAANLKADPEFDENTRLAVIGQYQEPSFYWEHFDSKYFIMGIEGYWPNHNSKNRFLEYYIGLPISFVSDEEAEEIRNTEAFSEMASYPYYGSMKMIGDVYVVKLSD